MLNKINKLVKLGILPTHSKNEAKLIRLLNIICVTWYFVIVFFITTDYFLGQKNYFQVALGHLFQFFALMFVQFFQSKQKYETARVLFIVSSYIQFYIFCNYLVPGDNIEFYYLLIPLFSLLFLNKTFYHFLFLCVSIISVLVPPQVFDHYEGGGISSSPLTVPVLFVTAFLLFSYFKNANTRNEKALAEEKAKALADKDKIEQQSIELKELNEFQNHFFVNVTHELKTPLTLIKGQVLQLQRQQTDQKQYSKILANTSRIEALVNDIIDVTKAASNNLSLNKTLISVNKVVQRQFLALQPLFDEQQIHYTLKLSEEELYSNLDQVYMERVIGNILLNASKYTPAKGNVEVEIEKLRDKVKIEVKDTGIGIPPEELQKVFDRFYQVKNDINLASGSGVGLSYCKEIVDLHGGGIHADNNVDRGAVFTVLLPLVEKESTSMEESIPTIADIDTGRVKILVADDNQEMREYLKEVLQNYEVIEASNGKEAINIIQNEEVDALVTDYMMPYVDGYELVQWVKNNHHNLPVIVVTARADTGSKLKVLSLGIDDYLTKPFVEDELIFRLKHSLTNAKNRIDFQVEARDSAEVNIINRAKKLVNSNIDNSQFGVIELAESLELTERTLYRKLKQETGLTPNQFIREIKLLFTRQLLENNTCNTLGELAQKVGFKNSTHLQKLYQERFGIKISL